MNDYYTIFHDEDSVHSARSFRIRSSSCIVESYLFLEQRQRNIDRNNRFARNVRRFSIGRHVTINPVFLRFNNMNFFKDLKILRGSSYSDLLNFVLEKFHFDAFSVNQQHILRLAVLNQLHDSFGIGMSAERHVLQKPK